MPRGEGEGAEIGVEALFDAGPQHFDRDGARPVRSLDRGAMHLRDRGGGDRRAETRKHRFERLAERGGDRRFGLSLRERRHLVLQPLEILGERRADHVRPRRQELAEFDVARAEPGQRRRQARVRGAGRSPFDQARQPQERPRRHRHGSRIDDAEHALAGEHEAGAAETDEMRGSGDHKRQPQCSATMPPVIC